MKLAKQITSLFLSTVIAVSLAGCMASGANSVVAKVGDTNIYKWEVDHLYNKNKSYYEEQAKINLDLNSNVEERDRFRQNLLQDLIKDTAVVIKAKETGYDLTEQEKQEVDKQYTEFVEKNINNYIENDFKGQSDAKEQATKKWNQWVKENNLTEEILKENMRNQKIQEKLTTDLYKNIAPKEEELKEAYFEIVQEQKEKYQADLAAYTQDAASPNERVFYTPPGYVRVKHILISMPDAINKQINAASKEQGPLLIEMTEKAVSKGKDDPRVLEIDKKIKDIEEQIKQLQAKGLEQVKAKAQEVEKELKAGVAFEELLEKYGEDPSMKIYPFNEHGYLVCEKSMFAKSFVTASLELEKAGDISELVESVNGYHIIKLIEKIEEKTKTFEETRDFLVLLKGAPERVKIMEEYSVKALQGLKVETFLKKL